MSNDKIEMCSTSNYLLALSTKYEYQMKTAKIITAMNKISIK